MRFLSLSYQEEKVAFKSSFAGAAVQTFKIPKSIFDFMLLLYLPTNFHIIVE